MIIGFSGRSQSGKDTAGEMVRYMLIKSLDSNISEHTSEITYADMCNDGLEFFEHIKEYPIKKYADILKDVTCHILGWSKKI